MTICERLIGFPSTFVQHQESLWERKCSKPSYILSQIKDTVKDYWGDLINCFSNMPECPDNFNIWASPKFRHPKATSAVQQSETPHASSGMLVPLFTSLTERDSAENKSCKARPEKFFMQTSDVCKKGLVIFDYTERTNTVILHPSWLNHWSCETTLDPQTEWSPRCIIDNIEELNRKAMQAIQSFQQSPTSSHQHETGIDCGNNVHDPVMEIKQKFDATLEMNNGKSRTVCNVAVETNDITGSSFSSSGKIESEFHEDTEEIDALLSSDSDLSSTGHSPGDASSRNSFELNEINAHCITGPKRKSQDLLPDIDDDADSGPRKADCNGSPEYQDAFQNCLSLGATNDCAYLKTQGSANFNEEPSLIRDASYYSSRGSSRTFRVPMSSAKRLKIMSNVQQLKNVIPGGNSWDTATLLTETVHTVKCLQSRLWDLKANRHLGRNSGRI